MSLRGKVCVVTGATRGVGKGIALQIGEAGATVYITGRTLESKPNSKGSLQETVQEIEKRGGKCIPVLCDHSKDADIIALFNQVKNEQNGKLDLLVNNAFSGVKVGANENFWENDPNIWDQVNNVGLRNHYLCSVYAAQMMVPAKQGLIVNISSFGGLTYLFTAAYGIGKAACDRMASDCAKELRSHNVAFISLWPGAVRTENLSTRASENKEDQNRILNNMFKYGETPEYAGRAVANLACDKNILKKSGRVLITGDLGDEYGFKDIDGRRPMNLRCPKDILVCYNRSWIAKLFPSSFKIPLWIFCFKSYQF